MDLQLKSCCSGCGESETTGLYGSNCKHMTLCSTCAKTMAENRAKCSTCDTTLTCLIREYNVHASSANDKNYFIGRFMTGLPDFSKKKSAKNKWSFQKDGLKGRQVTDSTREKYRNKPWLLEDETGQSQFQGHLEGSQSATYYLLMKGKKEFIAIPVGSWYNFNKVAQYKKLTYIFNHLCTSIIESLKGKVQVSYTRLLSEIFHQGKLTEILKYGLQNSFQGKAALKPLDFEALKLELREPMLKHMVDQMQVELVSQRARQDALESKIQELSTKQDVMVEQQAVMAEQQVQIMSSQEEMKSGISAILELLKKPPQP